MLYEYDLEVPANTAESDPVTLEMKLTAGVVNKVEVQFPTSTRALVHVQIFRAAHQVWPTNPEGNIKADGHTVVWDEDYKLEDEPLILIVSAWSEADTYDYTVTIRIAMMDLEKSEQVSGLLGSLKKLLKGMGIG